MVKKYPKSHKLEQGVKVEKMTSNVSDILGDPIITEKSTTLSAQSKYTFRVSKGSTKSSIKKAFELVFPGRKVLAIQTLKIKGHKKRTKSGFKLPLDSKKAVVTASGAKIEYFPEVS